MLEKHHKLALYMQDTLDSDYGKMGYGVMRYIDNPIVCVVDSTYAGQSVKDVCELPYDYPVVADVAQAAARGADVLVLGSAPSGGQVPDAWLEPLQTALQLGLCLVNGLHNDLNQQLGHLIPPARRAQQWIWDVRQPTFTPPIAMARAAALDNKRILLVGTDMAIGKMTAGLELYHWVKQQGHATAFVATGQIGITITGHGIPLDAFKLDHACGAVEAAVLDTADSDYVFVEGQGSLLHPGSSATLSLMRGSCATHLLLCHRAAMTHLRNPAHIKLPPLKDFIQLNEAVATACGALTPAKTIGVALNTAMLEHNAAQNAITQLEDEVGLPVDDVVRFGAAKLGQAVVDG